MAGPLRPNPPHPRWSENGRLDYLINTCTAITCYWYCFEVSFTVGKGELYYVIKLLFPATRIKITLREDTHKKRCFL